jgi:DNA-binding HxlR family transcriptional regulator
MAVVEGEERQEHEPHLVYHCPVLATMNLLNGKWTLHILLQLMDGRKRFNELARALGACSSRTLCSRLRALEEQGILTREIKHTIPPWVEYELTEKGQALNEVIASIARWGREHMQEVVAACEMGASAPEPLNEDCPCDAPSSP